MELGAIGMGKSERFCSTILFSLLSRNLSLSNENFLPRYFNLEGYLFAWTEEVSLAPLFMKNTPYFF